MKTAVDNLVIQTRRPQIITSIYLALRLKAKLNVREHKAEFSFTVLSLTAYEILRFARAKLYITLSNALNKHANNTMFLINSTDPYLNYKHLGQGKPNTSSNIFFILKLRTS